MISLWYDLCLDTVFFKVPMWFWYIARFENPWHKWKSSHVIRPLQVLFIVVFTSEVWELYEVQNTWAGLFKMQTSWTHINPMDSWIDSLNLELLPNY